jgi:pyruvate/2-oxoglutarate dehydrogenase complex dihydrolipoamide acyltransferase (E2) component
LVWDRVRAAAASSKYLTTVLNDLTFLGIGQGVARLVGPRDIVAAAKSRISDLEAHFRQVVGTPIKVQIEPTASDVTPAAPAPALAPQPATAAPTDPHAGANPAGPRVPMHEHPLVRKAIAELGATLLRVQPRVRPPSEPTPGGS